MQTIKLLQLIGLGDLIDNLTDDVKLEEIYIELESEDIRDIEDIFFLSRPNRTIIRISKEEIKR
jgi:hypothetical protein